MSDHSKTNNDFSRYVRQTRFAPFGEGGQRRLTESRVLVVGCGALGSNLAESFVRMGVGHVRIVDRDFVETTNLHRQTLFDEDDVAAELPKAVAAAEKLARVNRGVVVEPIVADVTHENIGEMAEGVDCIADGTDNFETRFLVNDYSIAFDVPWVYGGCVGAEGQAMAILPRETACLRCIMPDCPAPGTTPTCDSAGVLPPAVGVIAQLEAIEAMKILGGHRDAVSRHLTVVDLWNNRIRQIDLGSLRDAGRCPCCVQGEHPYLSGKGRSESLVLCGRNSVQISSAGQPVTLERLAGSLEGLGEVRRNAFLLKFKAEAHEITVFADGRAIVSGTDDPAEARTVYARYVGT